LSRKRRASRQKAPAKKAKSATKVLRRVPAVASPAAAAAPASNDQLELAPVIRAAAPGGAVPRRRPTAKSTSGAWLSGRGKGGSGSGRRFKLGADRVWCALGPCPGLRRRLQGPLARKRARDADNCSRSDCGLHRILRKPGCRQPTAPAERDAGALPGPLGSVNIHFVCTIGPMLLARAVRTTINRGGRPGPSAGGVLASILLCRP